MAKEPSDFLNKLVNTQTGHFECNSCDGWVVSKKYTRALMCPKQSAHLNRPQVVHVFREWLANAALCAQMKSPPV